MVTMQDYSKTPRLITTQDYPLISSWWKARNWPAVPQEVLSTMGLIIEPYCFGFIYSSDSKIAWLEFLCSNPATDSKERNEAMDILIEALVDLAKQQGFKFVFTSSVDTKLIDRLTKRGFGVTDKNVTHLLRSIQ